MDPLSKKLNALSERIRKAENAEAKPGRKAEPNAALGAGFDFAGAIIGSVILGFLLDRLLGTAPWFLLGLIVLGFINGSVGVWRFLQKPRNKEDKE